MRINSIANNINFGLLQTNHYNDCKKELVCLAKRQGKEKEAIKLTNEIQTKAPNAFLTTDDNGSIFVLGQKYNEKLRLFYVGDINGYKPIKTLSKLNNNLTKFEQNPDNMQLVNPEEVSDWWMYPFSVIQAQNKVPEILKKFFPIALIDQIAKKTIIKN